MLWSFPATASHFARLKRGLGGRVLMAWLLVLLLAMQVGAGNADHHRAHHDLAPSAELAAAIGHAVPICLNEERRGPSPADHDEHCGACCLMGADLAPGPVGSSPASPNTTGIVVAPALAREDVALRPRLAGGSSPRGPPPLV